MKRFGAFWLGIALACVTILPLPRAASAAEPRVSVLNFEGAEGRLGSQVAEVFLTDLARSGKLALVERSQVDKAIQEAAFGASGLVDVASASKVGKLVGAQKVIVGSLATQGDTVIVNARLLDVATGKVDAGDNIQGKADDVFLLVHTLANRFHHRLTGAWIPSLLGGAASGANTQVALLEQIDPWRWANNPDSALKVALWPNRPAGSTYKADEPLTLSFRVDVADRSRWGPTNECYVSIFNVDAQGQVYVLFPNHWVAEHKVTIGKDYHIPDDTYDLEFIGDPGEERFIAIASKQPLSVMDGQNEALRKPEILQAATSATTFATRGVAPRVKRLTPAEWGVTQINVFRAK